MKILSVALASISILSILSTGCTNDNFEPKEDDGKAIEELKLKVVQVQALDETQKFTFDFINNLAQDQSKSEDFNFSISPFSAQTALSMLAQGSEGETRKELLGILGTNDLISLQEANKALLQYLPSDKNGFQLKVANSMWYHQDYTIMDDYCNILSTYYNSPVNKLDFRNPTSIDIINRWASNSTDGKINKVFSDPRELAILRFTLANATYIKANWSDPFNAKLTADRTFHAEGGDKMVPTMKKSTNVLYAEDKGVKVVSIPFEGAETWFDIVLPPENTGIRDFAKTITFKQYKDLVERTGLYKTDLYLPKYSTKGVKDYELNKILSAM